ncbi:hypothetical protein NIIDNTM18_30690 [Mycolicibacterium litorale]|uniref:Uncharacterized protein n=1 Tax=Mycolicibacterium litorale TaxID=758802 RepID=A0A6S6P835_9MYCO|nr:hypothetical protein NIIDNTM18_30690 [Mycolicibacterium litorale]
MPTPDEFERDGGAGLDIAAGAVDGDDESHRRGLIRRAACNGNEGTLDYNMDRVEGCSAREPALCAERNCVRGFDLVSRVA